MSPISKSSTVQQPRRLPALRMRSSSPRRVLSRAAMREHDQLLHRPRTRAFVLKEFNIWLSQLEPLPPESNLTSDCNEDELIKRLRLRRVLREETEEGRLEHLKSILKTNLGKRRLKDTEDLQSVLQDLLHSSKFLKRTIFKYSRKKQWSQPKNSHLPSRIDDEIPLPQPGHAISFSLQSFIGEGKMDPILSGLPRYISPNGDGQCFPFLFLEEVEDAGYPEEAYLSNLHSASQALYNMYNLMMLTKKEEAIFENRVFSMVLEAHRLRSIRVHHAVKLPNGALSFQFAELLDWTETCDYACMVQAILIKYAAKEHYPALKSALIDFITKELASVVNHKAQTTYSGEPAPNHDEAHS